MIDNANKGVTDIRAAYYQVQQELMSCQDLKPEQKVIVSDLLYKIDDAISNAQSQFDYEVKEKSKKTVKLDHETAWG